MRRAFVLLGTLALSVAATRYAKSPGWLSIESPVNPYDASSRGAAFLVYAARPGAVPVVADLTGTAEGLVNGTRRSVPLRIDTTTRAGVFAVRRQWPTEGAWLVRINFMTTTAIVSLDRNGDVAGTRVPTVPGSGIQLPRPVPAREIDSTLAEAVKR